MVSLIIRIVFLQKRLQGGCHQCWTKRMGRRRFLAPDQTEPRVHNTSVIPKLLLMPLLFPSLIFPFHTSISSFLCPPLYPFAMSMSFNYSFCGCKCVATEVCLLWKGCSRHIDRLSSCLSHFPLKSHRTGERRRDSSGSGGGYVIIFVSGSSQVVRDINYAL